MRTTDSRHSTERAKFDLAMRMLEHGARVPLIERCTGLTASRIGHLFRELNAERAQRYTPKRGRLPHCATFYVKNSFIQSEATLLCTFLCAAGVIHVGEGGVEVAEVAANLELAKHFCEAFESYRQVVANPRITFERGWYLLEALEQCELELGVCRRCRSRYVRETAQVDNRECPQCKLKAAAISRMRARRTNQRARAARVLKEEMRCEPMAFLP